MSGIATTFLALPTMAAVLVAYFVSDWRMAGLIASASVAALILLLLLDTSAGAFFMPLLSGAAVGGLATLTVLRIRPSVSHWTRMSIALIVTFLSHLAFLSAL